MRDTIKNIKKDYNIYNNDNNCYMIIEDVFTVIEFDEGNNRISIYKEIYHPFKGIHCPTSLENYIMDEYGLDDENEEFEKLLENKLNQYEKKFNSQINEVCQNLKSITNILPIKKENIFCGSIQIGYFDIDDESFIKKYIYEIIG